jgi:hypothetical protein
MIAVEEKMFLDEKRVEIRFCSSCPIIMCRQNRYDGIQQNRRQNKDDSNAPMLFD